jgi:hypothetical protein
VQIVVNTLYLENSIELLEQHLLKVISASTSKQSGKLQGISLFKVMFQMFLDLQLKINSQHFRTLSDK